jgi:DNA-directed RNA polymerase specialized sigma24 family protein
LVTVVRNTAIDWYRRNSDRSRLARRLAVLGEPQRQIFGLIAIQGLSYVEAFEIMKSRGDYGGTFGEFLKEVRELHESVRHSSPGLVRDLVGINPFEGLAQDNINPTSDVLADCSLVTRCLSTMPLDVQTATLLFVVDGVAAGEVARIVGWPNAKAVYNRVYRALAAIREQLGERKEKNQ